MRKILFSMFLFFGVAGFAKVDPILENTVKTSVENVIDSYKIPGVSVSVVKNGEIVLNQGYGLRERGKEDLVDENTRFQVASLSKAFTAEVVSQLVNEGVLDYDVPIKTYLPDLELYDKITEESVTIRDLLSHQSGLPTIGKNGWRYWFLRNFSDKELYEHLKYMEPQIPFRSGFTYNNMNYFLVDMVVRKKTNMIMKDHVEARILKPLDMNRTTLSTSKMLKEDNKASPHFFPDFQKEAVVPYDTDQISAGFGVISTSSDMAKWIKYLLKKDFSKEEMFQVQTLFALDAFEDGSHEFTKEFLFRGDEKPGYGFGWMISEAQGEKVYLHTGLCNGFLSILAIIPSKELGLFFSINQLSNGQLILYNQLLDELLQVRDNDWQKAYVQFQYESEIKIGNENKAFLESISKEPLVFKDLSKLSGVYQHKGYGKVVIKYKKGNLEITLPSGEKGRLIALGGNKFQLVDICSHDEPKPWTATIDVESNQFVLDIHNYAKFIRI